MSACPEKRRYFLPPTKSVSQNETMPLFQPRDRLWLFLGIFSFSVGVFCEEPRLILDESRGPSAKQLMTIANQKLAAHAHQRDGCSTPSLQNDLNRISSPPPKGAFFCTLADAKPVETIEIRHENDLNFFEGIKTKLGLGDTLSDDVGRTAGFFGRYDKETPMTHQYIELRSDGFGKLAPQNGQWKDSAGRYYLQFLEIDQLTLGHREKIFSDKNGSLSKDIESQLEFRTTKSRGVIAQPVQESWHKSTNSNLQYHYLDGEADAVRMSVKAGVTKILKAELGDFKCSATGTALVGVDSSGKVIVENRIKAEIEKGDINSDFTLNPWWAISLWRNDAYSNQEFRSETGVKFSTGWKNSNGLIVKPFYGIVQYRSVDDRVYSLGSRGGQEPMHMIGLLIQFK